MKAALYCRVSAEEERLHSEATDGDFTTLL
jgi:hypothetical protein